MCNYNLEQSIEPLYLILFTIISKIVFHAIKFVVYLTITNNFHVGNISVMRYTIGLSW